MIVLRAITEIAQRLVLCIALAVMGLGFVLMFIAAGLAWVAGEDVL